MSAGMLAWALRAPVEDPRAKLVLVVLADVADGAGRAAVRRDTLARLTGQPERSVARQVAGLERRGLLSREGRSARRGADGAAPVLVCRLHAGGEPVEPAPPPAPPAGAGGQDAAPGAPAAAAAQRALFAALVRALGRSPVTKSERGAWNRAVKDLAEAGAVPDEIAGRVAAFRRLWPHATPTPTALAKHWSALTPAAGGRRVALGRT